VLEEQVELEVVGPPSTLANLKPSFGTWVDFQRGVGGGVNCVVDFGSCGSGDTVAYVERELLFANWIRWQPPEVTGMVAWEALAEVDGPQGVSVAEEPSFVFSTQGEESAGLVVFPRDATEHCAVLVVRDLRSGNELRSERFCAEPEVGEYAMGDNGLDSCAEPPNEELLEQWCEAVGDEPEACQPAAAGASAGGAGSAEAGGGASGEPTPKKGRSSSGCQLGGGEGSGAIALFLAVLAAGCRRRNKAKTSYDARA
jgi:hypothetical protein